MISLGLGLLAILARSLPKTRYGQAAVSVYTIKLFVLHLKAALVMIERSTVFLARNVAQTLWPSCTAVHVNWRQPGLIGLDCKLAIFVNGHTMSPVQVGTSGDNQAITSSDIKLTVSKTNHPLLFTLKPTPSIHHYTSINFQSFSKGQNLTVIFCEFDYCFAGNVFKNQKFVVK